MLVSISIIFVFLAACIWTQFAVNGMSVSPTSSDANYASYIASNASQWQNYSLICEQNKDCNVICGATESCKQLKINANGAKQFNVQCLNDNSCEQISIVGNDITSFSLQCSGSHSCYQAFIYVNIISTDVHINCSSSSSCLWAVFNVSNVQNESDIYVSCVNTLTVSTSNTNSACYSADFVLSNGLVNVINIDCASYDCYHTDFYTYSMNMSILSVMMSGPNAGSSSGIFLDDNTFGNVNIQCIGSGSCSSSRISGISFTGNIHKVCDGSASCSSASCTVKPINGDLDILCNGYNACYNARTYCPENGAFKCNMECIGGQEVCYGVTIYIPDRSYINKYNAASLTCDSTQIQACSNFEVKCHPPYYNDYSYIDARGCTVGKCGCPFTKDIIDCGDIDNCLIDCSTINNTNFSYHTGCQYAIINATMANTVTLICNTNTSDYSLCSGSILHCPSVKNYSNCNVHGLAMMKGVGDAMDINYNGGTFGSNLTVHCSTSCYHFDISVNINFGFVDIYSVSYSSFTSQGLNTNFKLYGAKQTVMYAASPSQIYVDCIDMYSCKSFNLNVQDSTNLDLSLRCMGIYSCQYSTINAMYAKNINIFCGGTNARTSSCGTNGWNMKYSNNIMIECNNQFINGSESGTYNDGACSDRTYNFDYSDNVHIKCSSYDCVQTKFIATNAKNVTIDFVSEYGGYKTDIYANQSDQLSVICSAENSCNSVKAYCPYSMENQCKLSCKNHSAVTDIDFYVPDDYTVNYFDIKCPLTAANYFDITWFCLGIKGYTYWHSLYPPTNCNNENCCPLIIETDTPTTYEPTTNNPTTKQPTTDILTTTYSTTSVQPSEPTTSQPTDFPTTTNPTTTPTTYEPTSPTSDPTTTAPTIATQYPSSNPTTEYPSFLNIAVVSQPHILISIIFVHFIL